MLSHQTVFLVLCGIYFLTLICLIIRLCVGLAKSEEAYRTKFLLSLFASIGILLLTKCIYYLGSQEVLDYGIRLYRFFGFVPPFLQGVCFLILSLSVQEALIFESQITQQDDVGKYQTIQKVTVWLTGIYAAGYILAYIFDQSIPTETGKNIYFGYRLVASVVIVAVVCWSSYKLRNMIQHLKEIYDATCWRHLLMLGLLFIHFVLKAITGILLISDVLLRIKCACFNDPSKWYYVGYLAAYNLLNEYVPCVMIIFMVTYHEEQNVRRRSTMSSRDDEDSSQSNSSLQRYKAPTTS